MFLEKKFFFNLTVLMEVLTSHNKTCCLFVVYVEYKYKCDWSFYSVLTTDSCDIYFVYIYYTTLSSLWHKFWCLLYVDITVGKDTINVGGSERIPGGGDFPSHSRKSVRSHRHLRNDRYNHLTLTKHNFIQNLHKIMLLIRQV